MKKSLFMRWSLAIAVSVATCTTAAASVVVAGTRVVYPSSSRDVAVRVNNNGEVPALVQSWVDAGDPTVKPEELDVPFTITPSVFRLDPGKVQVMRLVFLGAPLPKDRESVYWLNVLEIPPKPTGGTGENYLQFAIKTRIKVFYRPTGLPGTPEAATAKLRWSSQGVQNGDLQVRVDNPTPFHVSFAEVRATGGGAASESVNGMVPPLGSLTLRLKPGALVPAQAQRVQFKTVNDYGGFVDGTADLR
jgi:chaperone protein EcpD